MRRRIGAAVCCLLLLAQLVPPPQARAAGYLCFVAVGDSILPLSDSTMPFWRDGFLYVPASSFAGGARESLGIGQTANSEQVVLYRIGEPEEAIKAARRATELDPRYAEAYRLMGICQLAVKQREEGQASLLKAAELGDETAKSLLAEEENTQTSASGSE